MPASTPFPVTSSPRLPIRVDVDPTGLFCKSMRSPIYWPTGMVSLSTDRLGALTTTHPGWQILVAATCRESARRTLRTRPRARTVGTRLRLADFVKCFETAGFVVGSVHPHLGASADYLAAIRRLLTPEFRDRPDAELNILGALVCVRRPI